MSNDAEQWRFIAAIYSAAQGHKKGFLKILDLLRQDYPLTADDKAVLADFMEGKLKRGRGKPKKLFDDAHWMSLAVDRYHKQREGGGPTATAL